MTRPIGYSGLDDFHVTDRIDLHVLFEIVQVPGDGLKRNDFSGTAYEMRAQQRIEAHMSAYIKDDVTLAQPLLEQPLLVAFVASQPTPVIA